MVMVNFDLIFEQIQCIDFQLRGNDDNEIYIFLNVEMKIIKFISYLMNCLIVKKVNRYINFIYYNDVQYCEFVIYKSVCVIL